MPNSQIMTNGLDFGGIPPKNKHATYYLSSSIILSRHENFLSTFKYIVWIYHHRNDHENHLKGFVRLGGLNVYQAKKAFSGYNIRLFSSVHFFKRCYTPLNIAWFFYPKYFLKWLFDVYFSWSCYRNYSFNNHKWATTDRYR